MKGIIYKDFINALLPKNIITIFMNILISLAVVVWLNNFFGFILAVMSISLSGSSLLQLTMEQDELSNFDKFQLTFPLTKKQIVLSKYLGGLLMQSGYFLASLLIALGYYQFGGVSFALAMQVWVLGIIVGIIFFSISYTGFYLLGNKRGAVIYSIGVFIIIAGYTLTYFNFDFISILNIDHNILLASGVVLALLSVIVSYTLSLKIYTRKHS